MTWHELISDIAIIPAWECYIFGFLTASAIWFLVWLNEWRKK